MAGALFSLSAGGVMFETAVVIIIFSAMHITCQTYGDKQVYYH